MSALIALFLDVTVSLAERSFSKVRRYALADTLHGFPELTVEVLCDDPALDLAVMIGQPAVVYLDDTHFPRFDGIVCAVEQLSSEPSGLSCYAITVAPALWLTTERSGHHIFRDRTALEIAADVAARYGGRVAAPELRLSRAAADFQKYEYRVQYGETDRDFLFRILAEEGLVSCWAPSATDPQKLVWTLTDDTSIGSALFEVAFRPPSGALAASGAHVRAVMTRARLATSEAKLRDYDHENPLLELESRCLTGDGVPAEESLVRYSYAVGDFADGAAGLRLAQLRLEAARTRSRVYRWEASFSAPAGTRVRLHDHPRDDANGDFVIVSVQTEVEPNRRSHVVELVPAASPWRPAVPAKPRIHGTQTAFVVGAPGKEIDVDPEGRVEVQFRWDTRDLYEAGASRRVRVAMPWMGAGRGFWTLPRVGDEVVIAYLDGDPDEPLLVGSVNNAIAPPAASLPRCETQSWWKSKSTGGGEGYNAILMDDQKGAEVLALRAEKDLVVEAVHNSKTMVGGGAALSVVQGQSVEVGGDAEVSVQGKCTLTAGEVTIESAGTRTDKSALYHAIEASALLVTTQFAVKITTDVAQVEAKTVSVTADTITLTAGGASIVIGNGKITLSAPLVEINP